MPSCHHAALNVVLWVQARACAAHHVASVGCICHSSRPCRASACGCAVVLWACRSCSEALQFFKDATHTFAGVPFALQPKYAVTDGATALKDGTLEVHPGIFVINCYAHLVRAWLAGGAIYKAYSAAGKKEEGDNEDGEQPTGGGKSAVKQAKAHVITLADLWSEPVFREGVRLLLKYMREVQCERAAADLFERSYCTGYLMHWSFAFLAPGVPRTNNTAENRNLDFKEHGTHRERPVLTDLLGRVIPDYVEATAKAEQAKGWQATPIIERPTWELAQELLPTWATMAVVMDGVQLVASNSLRPILKELDDADAALVHRATQFLEQLKDPAAFATQLCAGGGSGYLPEYLGTVASFYILKVLPPRALPFPPTRDTKYLLYSCTCVQYYKYLHCKHAVAMGLVEGLFTVPIEYSVQPLGRKRQGGRAKKAKAMASSAKRWAAQRGEGMRTRALQAVAAARATAPNEVEQGEVGVGCAHHAVHTQQHLPAAHVLHMAAPMGVSVGLVPVAEVMRVAAAHGFRFGH